MALYFLDSSAIVKRYAAETGHAWVTTLCDPAQSHDLHIAQTALVEVVAALCRKAREAAITDADHDALINDFWDDATQVYAVQNVTTPIYQRAGDLCRIYRLRAYDAIQLGVALTVRDDALASNAPAPVFVCADGDLLAFASAEGLQVENPNSYP